MGTLESATQGRPGVKGSPTEADGQPRRDWGEESEREGLGRHRTSGQSGGRWTPITGVSEHRNAVGVKGRKRPPSMVYFLRREGPSGASEARPALWTPWGEEGTRPTRPTAGDALSFPGRRVLGKTTETERESWAFRCKNQQRVSLQASKQPNKMKPKMPTPSQHFLRDLLTLGLHPGTVDDFGIEAVFEWPGILASSNDLGQGSHRE